MDRVKQLIGYLNVEGKENYFRGAALVVDTRGIPVDFRYTEPVRPTRLERILYGSALDVYLREEVILGNLISAVETKPTIWLVTERDLIRPVQIISRLPAILLEPSTHAPLEQTGQLNPQAEKGTFLLQADGISSPLRVFVSDDNIAKMESYAQSLVAAASDMELLEPFHRINKALDAVTESES